MTGRIKIAAVSYTNTIPFVYGIEHTKNNLCADLILAIPKECAELFKRKEVDIALVPFATTLELTDFDIITPYCISSDDVVRTVVLMSDCDIKSIQRIYLDSHSRTSVELVKILAEKLWNITPTYEPLNSFDNLKIKSKNDAFLLIGDKVFDYEGRFAYKYDLCREWINLTGKPFVFAVWIARKGIKESVIKSLCNSLESGINQIENAVNERNYKDPKFILEYLTKNIKFNLTDDKREGMKLFLHYLRQKSEPSSYI